MDIKSTLVLEDRFTSTLSKVQQNAINGIQTFNRLNKEVEDLENSLAQAEKLNPNIVGTESYMRSVEALESMKGKLYDVANGEEDIITKTKEATHQFGAMDIVVGNIATKMLGMAVNGVKQIFAMSDSYTSLTARIGMMNDGLQTTEQLQQKIARAANRARVPYDSLATTISSLGNQAADAFGSNSELLAFGETLSKMFKVSGLDANGIQSVMYNLTQSLSSGQLLGNDYRILKMNAPQMVKIIQDFYGVSRKKLDDMVSKGKVSAQDLKNAMLKAGTDIEKQFKQMPVTISDLWVLLRNNMQKALQPLFKLVQKLTKAIVDHWDTIGPVLGEAVIALGALSAAWIGVSVAAKIAEAGGWAALAPYAAVIGLMAGFILLTNLAAQALSEWSGNTVSALGLIMGGFSAAFAFIWNLVLGFLDWIFGAINTLMNAFIDFGNFLGNVFHHPIESIVRLFSDMADAVLQILEKIASAIDKVFGSNLASAVGNWRAGLYDATENLFKTTTEGDPNNPVYKKYFDEFELSTDKLGLTRKGVNNAFNEGYDFGADIFNNDSNEKLDDILNGLNAVTTPTGGGGKALKTKNTDKLLSDEDIQLLLDVATRDYQLNYQQVTPNVTVTFGDVRETADVDQVLEAVGTRVEEIINGDGALEY